MVQWINALQNNSFVNPMQLPLLCRNSIAIDGRQASWLADEMQLNFEFLKFIVD